MPMYLGHPHNGAGTVAAALQARDIDMLRAVPSEVNIDVHIAIKQPAYSSYMMNLPAFMLATARRERVAINNVEGFVLRFALADAMPLRYPPLAIDFPRPPAENVIQQLSAIGYEEVSIQNNKQQMVFRTYDIENVKFFRSLHANPLSRCTVTTINLDSFVHLQLILRLFSAFFKTHTYPAFSDEETDKFPFDDFSEVYGLDRSRKRKRQGDDGANRDDPEGDQADDDDEEMEDPETPLSPIERIILYSAKPQRQEDTCWGSTDQIPNMPGILCPFVEPLATNDKNGLPALVRRYFFQCLGPTFAAQTAMFDKLKSAWGNISTTRCGDALSHMSVMIDIGLRAQARPFPIFDGGEYVGCVLSGSRFMIRCSGSLFRPISYTDLQAQMAIVKFHSAVLTSISQNATGNDDRRAIKESTTMRQLSKVLMGLALTEEAKDDIRKEAIHLNFGELAWAMNSTTLAKAIALVGDSGSEIPDDVPMHHTCLFDNDRLTSVLSAFGYQAPTFMIPSCPNIRVNRGSEPPKTFVYRAVSLAAAVADWRAMMEQKRITNNPTNLSKQHKDRSLSGGDKRSIWQKLCDSVNAQSAAGNEGGGTGGNAGTIIVGGDDDEDLLAF